MKDNNWTCDSAPAPAEKLRYIVGHLTITSSFSEGGTGVPVNIQWLTCEAKRAAWRKLESEYLITLLLIWEIPEFWTGCIVHFWSKNSHKILRMVGNADPTLTVWKDRLQESLWRGRRCDVSYNSRKTPASTREAERLEGGHKAWLISWGNRYLTLTFSLPGSCKLSA